MMTKYRYLNKLEQIDELLIVFTLLHDCSSVCNYCIYPVMLSRKVILYSYGFTLFYIFLCTAFNIVNYHSWFRVRRYEAVV